MCFSSDGLSPVCFPFLMPICCRHGCFYRVPGSDLLGCREFQCLAGAHSILAVALVSGNAGTFIEMICSCSHAFAFSFFYIHSYCSKDSFVTESSSNLRGKRCLRALVKHGSQSFALGAVAPLKDSVLPTQASMAGVMAGKGLCHWMMEH